MKISRPLFLPENTLVVAAFLLVLCGILTVLSGGAAHLPMDPALLQVLHLGVALILFFCAHKISFHWFTRGTGLRIFCIVFWLFLALLGVFGTRINGMCGWYRYGDLSIQPAGIGKGVYLAALCAAFSRRNAKLRLPTAGFVAALWGVPIVMQPDFTTAMIYFTIFVMLAFLAGCSWRWIVSLAALSAAGTGIFLLSHPYAWKRITGFFTQKIIDDNWHVTQFELTVSRGGWFGSRLGDVTWSNAYLPLAHNDSAYATLTETLGFCGALVVWALFGVMIACLIKMARRPGMDFTAKLYIEGAALWIALQGLVHVSVNLTMLPPTGLTLPFISYGGSSLAGFFMMLGWALAAASGNRTMEKIQ